VVIYVAKQQTALRFVNDEPDVFTYPHRPEVLVPRLVEPVEAHTRTGRVHLQVKRGGLDRLLAVPGKTRETVGEGVGDAEVHYARGQSFSLARRRSITLLDTANVLEMGFARYWRWASL